jgi:hypothetical protein
MDQIESARARLEDAIELPAVLDAAYDAFEEMLGEIENQQDGGGGAFGAFVMSGAAAANGRNALAAAPSLPPGPSEDLARVGARPSPGLELEDAAVALAGLSQLLSARLAAASDLSADVGDQVACAQAAHHAASICALLGGTPGP